MTREEKWLNGIAAGMNGESPLPEVPSKPVWHSEQMLAAIYDAVTEADAPRPFPPRAWRLDEFLYAVYCAVCGNDAVTPPTPADRLEEYWAGICGRLTGDDTAAVPSPVWRLEGYLKAIWDASANWGTEETLTGEVVSFTGKGSTRIRSLTAELTPVQSGSGTPAPDNARPIAGLTGCTVYVSPTQDPDDASTYDIDWTDEAGTIAGGTLDVTTGLLTVDTVFYTFDGTESGWIASGAYQGSFYRSTGVQHGNSGKCSHAEFTSNFSAYAYGKFALDGVGFVNINVFAQSAGTTVAQFKSWLAAQAANGTPLSFAVSLAAPRTYQLTPQAVAALIGENNVWSDAGNVTVTVKGAQSV